MRIAQITDTHVSAGGGFTSSLVDPNASLAVAVEALNSLPVAPDVVLVTGDLTDHGDPADYSLLNDLLDRIESPTYVIPGNHDDAPVMATAMAHLGYLPSEGHLSYVVDDHPVRLVGLDTTDPERHDGVFPDDRAGWLDEALSADQRPTLVFMHHPPFDTGIFFMDAVDLKGRERFREVVTTHPHVTRIVCGHVHRAIQANWGATTISVCPSTAHQVGLVLTDEVPPLITSEPPSYQMHLWDGAGFVTHTAPLAWDGPQVDLGEHIDDWSAARDRLRERPPQLKSSMGF